MAAGGVPATSRKMTLLPVITRELISAARQPFTYYLRALAVGGLLLVSLLFVMRSGLHPDEGATLFSCLSFALFVTIWILVPVLTADCISRERREGTLGLLFLTGLGASQIVVAKGLAHGLRAWSMWLAVLPVLAIPFLLGGVGWQEAVTSMLANFSAICWALAAGLLASAWSKRWLGALVKAMILSWLFLGLMASVAGWLLVSSLRIPFARWVSGEWDLGALLLASGVQLGFISSSASFGYGAFSTLTPAKLLRGIEIESAVSLFALMLVIAFAGARTRRAWHEEPPPAWQLWCQKVFCTPIVLDRFYHRWLRRRLEANPIGWLEQRTWSGRLVTWAWLAAVIALYSAMLSDRNSVRGYAGVQYLMAWLLVGSMAMTAAGSFRRERETRVMELLLVSPLREADIINGRLRGLWGQFLPAVGLLLGVWSYFSTFLPEFSDPRAILFQAGVYVTLPVIGLYYSLRCANFITSLLSTCLTAVLVPLVLPTLVYWVWWFWRSDGSYFRYSPGTNPWGSTLLCQFVFGALCWIRLHQRLKRRAFAVDGSDK